MSSSSSSSPTMIPSLPTEILALIVLELDIDGYIRYQSPRETDVVMHALQALCLTSKTFLPLARAHLYQRIGLNNFSYDDHSYSWRISHLPLPKSLGDYRLHQMLVKTPHLARLVTHFKLPESFGIDTTERMCLAFPPLLRAFTELQSLSLEEGGDAKLLAEILDEEQPPCRKLRFLRLPHVERTGALLYHLPHLEQLVLLRPPDRWQALPSSLRIDDRSFPFHLQTLQITYNIRSIAFLDLVCSSFASLRHLTLAPYAEFDLRHLQVLEQLVITDADRLFHPQSKAHHALVPAISLCPSIRRLDLDFRHGVEHATSRDYFASFPHSITIGLLFTISTRPKGLTMWDVSSSWGAGHPRVELHVMRKWKEGQPTLERQCEKRGLQLVCH